ncbi:MAG: RNA polymerase subunit sigma [Bacteroidetes bacterium HGW-Bacteroidetes-4]|jgi:RNA polymerase primary sigma factor|nr:MAG: RNA polymerase subunit sigma [Bacteroidetes bacterium HGW-Bacteroidetes-4]
MRQLTISKQITQRTDASISRYFQEINRYPMISAEEEVELSIRIKQGDNEALEKLVLANLRFVISVAKQYLNQGLSFSDLINEGNVGLVKAAQKFDETRGFKFISYAVWWIRQSIIQAISEQTRTVRLPLNRLSSINKIAKAMAHLEQQFQREPTEEEVAGYLEVSHEEVKIANNIKNRQLSFDMPMNSDSDSDFNLYDVVLSGNIPPPDSILMQESTATNIHRALEKLSKREAMILTLSFGLNNTQIHSLHDIAVKFDMSSERVRQIRGKGLTKLKNLLRGNDAFFEK